MHGMHGVCCRLLRRECSAIFVDTEKGCNAGGEMAQSYALTHCGCSSSRLHLPRPGRNREGNWPLADESATRRISESGSSRKRGGSPRHIRSEMDRIWDDRKLPSGARSPTSASHPYSRELLPPETKLGPDRCDSVAVQHLACASENNRFLDSDMVGIELLETRGLREQPLCFFYSQTARFYPG